MLEGLIVSVKVEPNPGTVENDSLESANVMALKPWPADGVKPLRGSSSKVPVHVAVEAALGSDGRRDQVTGPGPCGCGCDWGDAQR